MFIQTISVALIKIKKKLDRFSRNFYSYTLQGEVDHFLGLIVLL